MYPVVSLRAAQGQAETGDDLIEHQQSSALVAQLSQPLQKSRGRAYHTHVGSHRLYNDAGHLFRPGVKQGLHAGQIVKLGGEGVLDDILRHSGAAGMSSRQSGGPGGHQQTVTVSVIAALELDNLVPTGGAPGQPDGGHHSLGTGVDHAHHFNARHQLHHELGNLHLPGSRCAERQSVPDSFLHRLPDHGVVMAQNHGAPGADVVQIIPAVHIIDVAALGSLDKAGRQPHGTVGPDGGIHAAGQYPAGGSKQLL